ncbi:MAG: hypothetical protein FWD13_04865 [Treponema sp.]|nr:hypothetical protein [Treponema sp.]
MKKTKTPPPSICIILFLIILCSLFIGSCDLFAPADPDLLDKLHEELAWANAAKLTVNITYPAIWGTSNPQQGPLSGSAGSPRDIRLGFDNNFTIQFTPDQAYGLFGWLAYNTDELTIANLGFNWLDDPERLFGLNHVDPLLPSEFEFELTNPENNSYTFKLHTDTPVTLIPNCIPDIRVLRTEPRSGQRDQLVSRAASIILYFNASLNPASVRFAANAAADGILITSQSFDENGIPTNEPVIINNLYETPVYAATGGFFTVTINPTNNLPLANSRITVRVNGIESVNEEPMREDNTHSFSWLTSTGTEATFNSYGAECNIAETATSGFIEINWDTKDADRVVVYYRENRGWNNPVYDGEADNSTKVNVQNKRIPVLKLNDRNVRQGIAVTGINEYEIFIELYKDGVRLNLTSFKIWNIPGMNVTKTNIYHEIRTAAELSNIRNNPGFNYVLVNNISIPDDHLDEPTHPGNWTPIPSFTGNFYGNGHTITIESFASAGSAANFGLFGVAGASTVNDTTLIRDLTVHYQTATSDEVPINPIGAAQFGGIAGSTQRNAKLINVLTTGSVVFDVSGDTHANVGGLAGLMTGSSSLFNSYSALDLTVNKTFVEPSNTSLYVGGLVGSLGVPDLGSRVSVRQSSAAGNITVGSSANPVNVNNRQITGPGEGLCVGGIAGYIYGPEGAKAILHNSEYRQGIITIWNEIGLLSIGGAVGYSVNADIQECTAQQRSLNINKTDVSNNLYIGGFIGDSLRSIIKYCESTGPVIFHSDISDLIFTAIGGFIGGASNEISYCYTTGDVSVVVNDGNIRVGGFIGFLSGDISNCFASGNVNVVASLNENVELTGYEFIHAGGFAGEIGGNGKPTNCYATGDIFADISFSKDYRLAAGGFSGYMVNGIIEHCFSTGVVFAQRNTHTSGSFSVGGLVGYVERPALISLGNISNSAALGISLTATGCDDSLRKTGRIFGEAGGFGTLTLANNHAFNGMAIYEDDDYGKPTISITPFVPTSTNAASKDGADVHPGTTRLRSFWTGNAPSGLGFSLAHWDFTLVGIRGYPRLSDGRGGVLAGQ